MQHKKIKYIFHRVNKISELIKLNPQYGCEIDIRYHKEDLIIHHDPFHHPIHKCDLFEKWLEEFSKYFDCYAPLIVNIKTEGIEEYCINLLNRFKITNYFFLDLSMPYIVKYALLAKSNKIPFFSSKNLAVRYSEFEPIEYALSFTGMADWVWVDCFTKLPLNQEIIGKLKKAKFKICLVSPELQDHDVSMINTFCEQLFNLNYLPDAICTKNPNLWELALK